MTDKEWGGTDKGNNSFSIIHGVELFLFTQEQETGLGKTESERRD